jgi:tetratricopeptide (TPR) repeat protein
MRVTLAGAIRYFLLLLPFVLAGCGREQSPEERQADSTLTVAQSLFQRGAYRSARPLLHAVRFLDTRLNRPKNLAETYRLLAEMSVLSSDFDSAFFFFARSEEQFKALSDRPGARSMMLRIAELHSQLGEYRTAHDMYAENLRLASVFKDDEGTRALQMAMLPALRALGRDDELTQIGAALQKAALDAGDVHMQARSNLELALTQIHTGSDSLALDPLLQALSLAGRADDSLMTIAVLTQLANTYESLGRTDQALETFTEALTRTDHAAGAESIKRETLIHVGNVYYGHGHYAEAARFYRAALTNALATGDRLAEGYMFIQLGNCTLVSGKFDEAVKNIESAASLFEGAGYAPGQAFAATSFGLAHQRAGHSNDAIDFYKKAIALREATVTKRTDVYRECEQLVLQGRTDYNILVELLLRVGKNDDAFWYAERERRSSLFAKLTSLELRTRDELTNSLLRQMQHARALQCGAENQLALLLAHGPDDAGLRKLAADRIVSSQRAVEELGASVTKSAPLLEAATRIDGSTITDVQRSLPPGAILLRPISTTRSIYIFAVSATRSQMQLAAVDRGRLKSDVAEYLHTMRLVNALVDSPAVQRAPLDARIQALSPELYAALLRPIESSIAGARTILYVPDDVTTSLPMHALRRAGSGTPYVIEQAGFGYLPAVSLLRQRTQSGAVTSVAGIGYSATAAWDVEYELRDVRAFYKDARLYFGDQASLPTLMKESGQVLHLAAELRYSSAYPGNASVLLADPRIKDITKEYSWGEFLGTASFGTVLLSHLDADSVAVDELLPSLFLMNGSSTVLVNSLPTSRKAKKVFGELFYTALLAGQSADEAYRQALLEMIRNRELAPPLAWVPFTAWKFSP